MELELKQLQDDYIKLVKENEERKSSLTYKDTLIKQLMKDCEDKKRLIEEGKNVIKDKDLEISKYKNDLEELNIKIEKEKESYEIKIKETQEIAAKNVPMLTKKFKELMLEIEKLKKEKNDIQLKYQELSEEKNDFHNKLESANKSTKEVQMKLKAKEALIKQFQKRLSTMSNDSDVDTGKKENEVLNNNNSVEQVEINKLKEDIIKKDEIISRLSIEKEEIEERLKSVMMDNKDELIQNINRKDEDIYLEKNKFEDSEKKLKTYNDEKNGNKDEENKNNIEEKLKFKKNE